MTWPFTSLNPQEAQHVATFIEDRNADVYYRFAEMFAEFRDTESPEIADVFWDMAVQEKRHSAILRGKYHEHFGDQSCRDMSEVPKLENGDVFAAPEKAQNSPRAGVAGRTGSGEERS
jgi:rubrerythrin